MKKVVPVVAVVSSLLLTVSVSISAQTNKNASGTPACSGSSCRQYAGSGKQQASAQVSPSKKQSAKKKVCSSITGILKREIRGTKNKTKLGILKGGLKYADEVCGRGGIPDLSKLTKGLPEQDKIRISQKTGAALFDGAGGRASKDFTPATSKPAAALPGKGGQVLSLKSADPNISKISPPTDFSLQKKPASLLASAKSAVTPKVALADSASAMPVCPRDMKGVSAPPPDYYACKQFCYVPIDWDDPTSLGIIQCIYEDCICSNGKNIGPPDPSWSTYQCDRKCDELYPPEPSKTGLIKGIINGITAPIRWIKEKLKERKEKKDTEAIANWKKKIPIEFIYAQPICNGKGGFAIDYGSWEGAPCGMKDVVKKHENAHIRDYAAAGFSKACVGIKERISPPVILPKKSAVEFEEKTECRVFQYVEIPDLKDRISKATTSACQKFLQDELNDDKAAIFSDKEPGKKGYYEHYNCGTYKDANGKNLFTKP